MKSYLFSLCLLLVLSCSHQDKKLKKTNPDKPNIVWIIAEDLSPDLGCYGNNQVKTPAFDDLSKHGVRYTNAFAVGAACSPSRTAFVTGYYQNSIGAHHMRYPEHLRPELPEGVIPIHTILHENGYQTANILSAPGNGKTDWLFKYDTDTYDHQKWDSLKAGRPFFARINLGLTHRSFVKDTINPIDPALIRLPPYYPDHPVAKKDWALYFESVQVLDRQIEQIISDLKRHNLLKNTIIFFFSDHGRPMTRGKNYLYDSGLKVPLIISSYDENIKNKYLQPTETDDLLVSLLDVNATGLSLAGVNSYHSQGIPFLGTANVISRKFVHGAADRTGETFFKSRTVRNKNFRYIRNYNRDFSVNSAATAYRKANHPIYHLLNILNERGELNQHQAKLLQNLEYEELYDLQNDPYELNNLADNSDWSAELSEMRQNLDTWIREINDKGLVNDTQEIISAFDNYRKGSEKRYKKQILQLEKKVRSSVHIEK